MKENDNIAVRPATPDRWQDFETLMGPKGGSGGCWCMLWRQDRKSDDANKGDRNKSLINAVFDGPVPPGLLAYERTEPVGWLSVAPRSTFVRMASSRILKPVDEKPVWSISCFLIRRSHRRLGVGIALLEAAKTFVREQGGDILEGYPVDPDKPSYPSVYAWTGMAETFRRAGFVEVTRRSPTRPVMRFDIGPAAD